jgi:hypothetical protein
MNQLIEIPELYLYLAVGFAVLISVACLCMGYALGKDVCRPARDYRGRFVKR